MDIEIASFAAASSESSSPASFELDWNLDGDTQVDVVVASPFELGSVKLGPFGLADGPWRGRDGRDPGADEAAPLV